MPRLLSAILVATSVALAGCHRQRDYSCIDPVPEPMNGSAIAISNGDPGVVDGRILRIDGEPVTGATVVIGNRSTVAAKDGTFSLAISRLAAGTYTLRVLAIGYSKASREVTIADKRGLHILAAMESQPMALTDQCGFIPRGR